MVKKDDFVHDWSTLPRSRPGSPSRVDIYLKQGSNYYLQHESLEVVAAADTEIVVNLGAPLGNHKYLRHERELMRA